MHSTQRSKQKKRSRKVSIEFDGIRPLSMTSSVHSQPSQPHKPLAGVAAVGETRQFILHCLGKIVLLRRASSAQLNALCDSMRELEVEHGGTVVRQGEQGDLCFVVVRGIFVAEVDIGSGSSSNRRKADKKT